MSNIQLKNPELSSFIAELHNYRSNEGIKILLNILNLLIQQTREENDHIDPLELKHNQGKIEVYSTIKRYIESGLGNL